MPSCSRGWRRWRGRSESILRRSEDGPLVFPLLEPVVRFPTYDPERLRQFELVALLEAIKHPSRPQGLLQVEATPPSSAIDPKTDESRLPAHSAKQEFEEGMRLLQSSRDGEHYRAGLSKKP